MLTYEKNKCDANKHLSIKYNPPTSVIIMPIPRVKHVRDCLDTYHYLNDNPREYTVN